MENFSQKPSSLPPLAEQLRPQELDEVIGQDHLIGDNRPLTLFMKQEKLPSLIFWGNPGTGKTTLAQILAQKSRKKILLYSAVTLSVSDLKKIFAQTKTENNGNVIKNSLCIFIDEIHRFNKAQQDILLHPLESGLITLIGATTENPSFSLNSALLSRVQVFTLNRIGEEGLLQLWDRGKKCLNKDFPSELKKIVVSWADGDARRLYNLMEILNNIPNLNSLAPEDIETLLAQKISLYDRDGEEHYNLISALHKSLRGSDVNASLYWLSRMLNGGEDPRYIARRLLRMAYEDVGLADLHAPQVALNAWETYERLGSPEGEIALAKTVIYLALAPKSNRVYTAFSQAQKTAKELPLEPPPLIIRNPVTKLMKSLGYGQGYRYDHDEADNFSGQNYFPDKIKRKEFYVVDETKVFGFEREIKKRLHYFSQLRKEKSKPPNK